MTENTRYRLTAIAVALPAFMSAKAFAAGASEPGLPQLDIATWPSQLFWLVVLFGAGYVVMAKMVTPRIGAVLEERRQTLDGDLEKARNASADAAKTRAEYESDLEKARSDAAEFAKQAAMEATKKPRQQTPKSRASWPIRLQALKLHWQKRKPKHWLILMMSQPKLLWTQLPHLPESKPPVHRRVKPQRQLPQNWPSREQTDGTGNRS